MKNVIAILFLAALATSAQAEDKVSVCKTLSKVAESLMAARQDNIPLSDLLEIAAKQKSEIGAAMTEYVVSAYEVPAYSSQKFKQAAISSFRDEMMLVCMKSKSSKD